MNLRRTTSLTALLSFLILAVSGVVLFLAPQGRVAYWSEWRLWGLSKEAWSAMHILLSLLFLVASLVHIVLNAKPILLYLKNRKNQFRVLTPDFAVSAILTLLFTVGPLLGWPPFRWLMDLNTYAKNVGSRTHGEPPYGHAELSSLQAFAQKTGVDLERAQALLKAKGIAFEGTQERLQDIAKRNHMTPQQVYLAIKEAQVVQTQKGQLPEEVAPGLGRKTLAELCDEYGLDRTRVAGILEARKIPLRMDQPMRAYAEANGTGPHELYAVIREGLRQETPGGPAPSQVSYQPRR